MDDTFGMLHSDCPLDRKLLTVVMCNMAASLRELLSKYSHQEAPPLLNAPLEEATANTALHVACYKGHDSCVALLLAAGATPSAVNRWGLTPMALALRHGHAACVRMLLECGGPLSDPGLVWTATGFAGRPPWPDYAVVVLRLLLVATPDLRRFGDGVSAHLCDGPLRQALLLRVFALAGNRLDAAQTAALQEGAGAGGEELGQWMAAYARSVQSLQHYARLAVRRQLRPNVLSGALALPLPPKMRDYLIFS